MLAPSQIARIPKVELHLHLEGSVPAALYVDLAKENGVTPCAVEDRGDKYSYRYDDFPGFLRCFGEVCRVLKKPEDYARAAGALFDRLIAENVCYAEIFLSPSIYSRLGGCGILDAMPHIFGEAARRKEQYGFECRFLFDAVRQWGPPALAQTLTLAAQCRSWNVIGIGIGGDEGSLPARDFADLFEQARRDGFHTTAHAGETQGAQSVWDTMEFLRPERIGHGLSAAQDARLLRSLWQQGTVLDICPTSNLRTGLCGSLAAHPLLKLREKEIPFTINTDDPGLFDTHLNKELALAGELLDWGLQELRENQLQAAHACFLDAAGKEALIARMSKERSIR